MDSRRFVGTLRCLALVAVGGLFFSGGCGHEAPPAAVDFHAPLPAGMVALRKISPEQYPDFGRQPIDPALMTVAIDHSLSYLAKPSSQAFYPYLDISHERAVATCQRLRQICQDLQKRRVWDPAWFNQEIRENFDVYKSIGAPEADGSSYTDRVLFTGYCTPVYDASLTRTADYVWPLYKAPQDLVRDPRTMEVLGRRDLNGLLVPYYTRQEIETGQKLAGQELVWLRSRWEAYIITVQGSARLRLSDGRIYEIGYAGNNGYPYSSPGERMLADGVISRDQLSLKGLGAYFAAHPDAMDRYLSLNQRYIFFAERPGGPFGSLNEPVTAFATIATDKASRDIYPRAMPAYLVTQIPAMPVGGASAGTVPFSNFAMDQDTGGAIRASGRCDIYMGVGADAESMAGQQLQEGALYYIAVKQTPAAGQ